MIGVGFRVPEHLQIDQSQPILVVQVGTPQSTDNHPSVAPSEGPVTVLTESLQHATTLSCSQSPNLIISATEHVVIVT
jgi:hypothetical protein